MTAMQGAAQLLVAGDVFPNVPDGRASFAPLLGLLGGADIVAGNCEGVYTDRPAPSPSHKHMMVGPRQHGTMLGELPFHVMGLANNHMMDGGYIGLSDTIELLEGQGIGVFGAGPTLADAIRPLVVERQGQRIAFLGFCSVFPVGYEARAKRPGIAPLRVRTFYADPDPNFWEPGIDPLIVTDAFSEDLQRYREAIAGARNEADVVIVLPHWGYSSRLEILQDYERRLAREAVDAGADVVLCAHHHSLRGIEFHNGQPIFYGLGTLVHHLQTLYPPSPEELARRYRKFGEQAHIPDKDFPLFPFNRDARMSGLASIEVRDGHVGAVGFYPAQILGDGSTEPLLAGDERVPAFVAYLARISRQQGFDTAFTVTERDGHTFFELAPATVDAAGSDKVTDGERVPV